MKKWNYEFNVPEEKKIRMLVHTDCKNEADDQFALAHHLMTPKFEVRGIIGAHFNLNPQSYGEGNTAQASVDEIYKVLDLMGLSGEYPVCKGAEYPLADAHTPQVSDGAQLIIDEALREDDRPLFIACQGGVTDVASALLLCPEIVSRITVIWIGGGAYPEGGMEFNLMQDIHAANVLFASQAGLWQVPKNVYKQVSVSLAMLQKNVLPYGKIGEYLFRQMVEFNDRCAKIPHWPHGEIWGLGDNPTIGVLLFESELSDVYEELPAPQVDFETLKYLPAPQNRKIRVYKDANARLTLDDFFAKLQINFPKRDS